MASVEQLQLSDLQAFLPVVVSEADYKTEKMVGMTLKMDVDFAEVCRADCVSKTLSLGECARRIREYCKALAEPTYVTDFSRKMIEIIDGIEGRECGIDLVIRLPGSNSLCKEVSYRVKRDGGEWTESLMIGDMHGRVVIGCSDVERRQAQDVGLEVELTYPRVSREYLPRINIQSLISSVIGEMEKGGYNTMEGLTNRIVNFIEERYYFIKVCAFLQKIHSVRGGSGSGVRIERATGHLEMVNRRYIEAADGQRPNTGYLCLGSNIGDKLCNIHKALDLLKKDEGVVIVDTSFLYLSGYQGSHDVEDKEFLNVVVKINTSHSPSSLLRVAKRIEESIGRKKLKRGDGRRIDLDILFYNNLVVDSGDLAIPHSRMHLREWVLRPLGDIDPFFIHPRYNISVACLLEDYLRKIDYNVPMELEAGEMPCVRVERVIQVGRRLHKWESRGSTLVMGVLNVTPDSFSDGGLHLNLQDAKRRFAEMVEQGADIIDIGGVSTRPGADEVEVSEEYSRVIPVLEAVREINKDVVISIDTTTPEIARECLKRGADFINTTLHTSETPEMYELIASSNVPIILMHSRGTPKTMTSLASSSRGESLLQEISRETNGILMEARKKGVYKWNVILDPGIGFAKTPDPEPRDDV